MEMQVWDKEQRSFVSVNQDTTEWKEGPHPSGTGTAWYNTKTGEIQVAVPAVVKAAASGAHGVKGPYDAMNSGVALTVRNLIEEHRDKMLTIRRRDFEVTKLFVSAPTTYIFPLDQARTATRSGNVLRAGGSPGARDLPPHRTLASPVQSYGRHARVRHDSDGCVRPGRVCGGWRRGCGQGAAVDLGGFGREMG